MDENLIRKTMPSSVEAELSVIGAMLIDKDALIYASEHLQPDQFYSNKYRLFFESICELNNDRRDVDLVTLQDKLREKSAPPEICEIGFIQNIVYDVPSAANVKEYCDIVAEKSLRRKLIKTAEDIANRGYVAGDNTNNLLEQTEKDIFELLQKRGSEEFVPIDRIVMDTLDNIQKASKTSGNITGIPSGFIDLDMYTAGFQNSDLILIAARPAMGKTAFVLNIAEYAAVRKNYNVAVFSLEMGKEQLVTRMLAMDSNVNSQQLRTGKLNDGEWDRLVESAGNIGRSHLMIYDTPGITVSELRSRCRRMKLEKGLDMVIIDYLQLMSGSGRTDSRQQEISDISRSLKVLARELNIPVIALSQLSRAVEQRVDHRPMLSDLRESGAIEQDADIVMFIYREDYYKPDTERKNISEIIIAKQRNGSIGTVELVWLPDYTKFGNLEKKR